MREKSKAAYMISSVAEQYGVHPQTLRLYERAASGECGLRGPQSLRRLVARRTRIGRATRGEGVGGRLRPPRILRICGISGYLE